VRHTQNLIVSDELFGDLSKVDVTVIQMKLQSTSVWNSALLKNICDQQYHDITHEALKIKAALRSHQIDNMKTAYFSNNSEHEFFYADLLPRPFWRFFAMDAPLLGVLILKGEPTLGIRDNGAKCVRLHALWQWQQLLAFLDSYGSELFGQLIGNPLQIEIFQVNRVAQMFQNRRVRHIEDLRK
jgi:hypothetical protein